MSHRCHRPAWRVLTSRKGTIDHARRAGLVLLLATVAVLVASESHAAPARQVAAGGGHTCVVTTSGKVQCWGSNQFGQLGDGTNASKAIPADVVGLTGVKVVATGAYHTCALTNAGGVKCWGYNAPGTLGDGYGTDRSTPVDVVGLTNGAVAVTAGTYHTCAVNGNGGVLCWGYNGSGQLGDGTTTSHGVPVFAAGLTSGAVTVAAGGNFTCAVTSSGGLKCWGANGLGQLGNGSTTNSLSPVNVTGLTGGVAAVAAGGAHACAMVGGGGVKCWGYNYYGQLGDSTATGHTTPVDVSGLATGAAWIAAGDLHTCAVTSVGGVKCWGSNYLGRLGDGTTTDRSTPTTVTGLTNGAVAATAGRYHACALTAGGGVKCWGDNTYGQLADTTPPPDRPTPVDVLGLTAGVVGLQAGLDDTCAVTSDGTVKCWGWNYFGQLGDGTNLSRSSPVSLWGRILGFIGLAGGGYHTCAAGSTFSGMQVNAMGLLTDGSGMECWGRNDFGEVGDGTTTGRLRPIQVSTVRRGVQALAAGELHTCVVAATFSGSQWNGMPLLTTGGGLRCWGGNSAGQVGDGTTTDRSTPVDVSGLTSGVARVAAGARHTCAVTTAGGVTCWGANAYGQLGDGTPLPHPTPVGVSGLPAGAVTVAAGAEHTCAITSPFSGTQFIATGLLLNGGAARCWGRNDHGQVGDSTTTDRSTPTDVTGMASGVTAVTAGSTHSCALTTAGGVRCWGGNAYGQLGDGSTTDRQAPMDVVGLASGVVAVSAGGFHTCALTSTGGVKCWGSGFAGQLGDTPTYRVTPVFAQGFDYPSITALAPSVATTRRGGFTLTVYGTDFLAGATMQFDGAARPTMRVSSGELRGTLSAGDLARARTVLVTVVNQPAEQASNPVPFVVRVPGKDFSGDGRSDILWESSAGWVAAWLMNGTVQTQNLLLYDYPVAVGGWHIVGTGDFNGDGQSDILWQSDGGYVAAWMMDGTTQMFNQLLYDYPVAAGGWHIVTAGDLDGDGISDILWQDNQGYVAYWLMGVNANGRAYQRSNALLDTRPVAAGGWWIVGTGDLNGDGMTDLVWQSPDGYVAAWIMNGLAQASSTLLYGVPVATDGWTVVGTADMNGDGMVDILWQQRPLSPTDTSRGYVATWLMNGTAHANSVLLTPSRVTDPAWRIVGPK